MCHLLWPCIWIWFGKTGPNLVWQAGKSISSRSLYPETHQTWSFLESLELLSTLQVCTYYPYYSTQCLIGTYFCKTGFTNSQMAKAPSLGEAWSYRKLWGYQLRPQQFQPALLLFFCADILRLFWNFFGLLSVYKTGLYYTLSYQTPRTKTNIETCVGILWGLKTSVPICLRHFELIHD